VASEVVQAQQPSLPKRVVTFWNDVVAEMRKVTWPERPQVTQLSIGVIGLSLFIGAVIWLLDLILQGVLVRGIPALFGA
jgi:preprotein translocase subunit SecE